MGAALDVVTAKNVAQVAELNDRVDEFSLKLRNNVVGGILKVGDVADAVFRALSDGLNGLGDPAAADPLLQAIAGVKGALAGLDDTAVAEQMSAAAEATRAAEAAAGKYADEQERAKGELEMQQFLAAQQVEILDQQIAAGKELADQKAEAFAMEIAALEAIGDAEEQRTGELKKQSEEAARLRGLLDNAPYSDLRRIGGGHRNEVLGPVSGGGGGVPRVPGGAGDAVSAAGLERVADGVLRLERLNELIEGNTMRTAEAVQRVAAATAYSPEQDLRALLDVGRDVVSAVEEVGDRLAKGLIVEARVG
jgi:hypothetical protein